MPITGIGIRFRLVSPCPLALVAVCYGTVGARAPGLARTTYACVVVWPLTGGSLVLRLAP